MRWCRDLLGQNINFEVVEIILNICGISSGIDDRNMFIVLTDNDIRQTVITPREDIDIEII
jgi:hypothetical protein